MAPYRDGLVVAVECLFTWYWRADLWAQAGIPCVLGHALSMKAIHGGNAKNDTIDSHQIAPLLRGGMLPKASGSPAQMRATRALLRRRTPLRRTRAALVSHVPNTNAPYHVPALGQQRADTANRAGVAERFHDPAVHKTIEVDLALLTYSDAWLKELALSIFKTAKQHEAHPLSLLQTVPGIGKILSSTLSIYRHVSHN